LRLAAVGKNLESYTKNFETVVARAQERSAGTASISSSSLMERDAKDGRGMEPTPAPLGTFCPVEWMPMVANDGMHVGSGGFGDVYIANISCGDDNVTKMAFKVQKDKSGSNDWEHDKELWEGEAQMGMLLDHPYIIKVFDSSKLDNGMGVIAMEAAVGGELKTHWGELKDATVNHQELAEFTLQILWGLKYMHDNGYVHGDFKPEQVVLRCNSQSACEVRIADLGLVVKATEGSPYPGLRGSPSFLAPEVVAQQGISPKSDMWALGMSLHELMAHGRMPGDTIWNLQVFYQKLRGLYRQGMANPDLSIFTKALAKENSKRNQLFDGLLKYNPENRINADSAIELAKQWAEAEGVDQSKIDAIMLKGNAIEGNAQGAMPPACWQVCKNAKCGTNKACKCWSKCNRAWCSRKK